MTADPRDERIRALEDEIRRLHVMLEHAPSFITRITTEGLFLYLNRLAPGFEMKDVVGTSIDGYVPPSLRARAHEAMRQASETQTTQEYGTLGQVSADQLGHYLTRVSPIVEDGKVSSLVMVATDVTALEESRLLLQLALNATGLGTWTFDPRTGRSSWDATTRRIFGLSATEEAPSVQEMMATLIHPEDRALVEESIDKARSDGVYGPFEHRIVRKDGEVRWVAASALKIKEQGGEGEQTLRIVGSVMDISQRRAMEARLFEAQKLESIGRLAGGVAHDFNNMLTAMLGNVDLADRLDSVADIKPLLAEIRLAAERSAALTAQLLAFARRQRVEPKVLDPNALLWRIEGLLRRLLGDQISLKLELQSRGRLRADESQLEQVVLNLITNARDCMPEGGNVVLSTRDLELGEADAVRYADLRPGPHVAIEVKDDGPGIPRSAQSQIFEPFFTTRTGGTGLGLATCYGIVKQSSAHIAVESEEGRGSTFSVVFPRASASSGQAQPAAPALHPAGGHERILLVEDEAAVRSVLQRALERAGYRVAVATSAEEALASLDELTLDLLITDVVMPGISGWELGRLVRQQRPELRILYISGYSGEAHEAGEGQEVPFLQKPFLPEALLSTVRRLLDQ